MKNSSVIRFVLNVGLAVSTVTFAISASAADPIKISLVNWADTQAVTYTAKYVLETNPRPEWSEAYCSENTSMIAIGKESYFLGGDGMLMPVRKGQAPPDLRYFKQAGK